MNRTYASFRRVPAHTICGIFVMYFLFIGSTGRVAGGPLYHVVPLASNGLLSGANSINSLGQAAGYIDPQRNADAAVRWTSPSSVQVLSNVYSSAFAINDSGMAGGSANGFQAVIWSSIGAIQQLPRIPVVSYESWVQGLNNSGMAAGEATNGSDRTDAFRWSSSGGMQDLGIGLGRAINGAGDEVGQNANGDPCVWPIAGTMIDLSPPGGRQPGTAFAINSSGVVVGEADKTVVGGFNGAFRWTSVTGMTNLGLLPGTNKGQALGVNDGEQIVGICVSQIPGFPDVDKPFLWTSTSGMVNLNSLLDSSSKSWTIQYAGAINNSGEIAGYGIGSSGLRQALLLVPVPEPSAYLLAAIGASGLWIVRRRGAEFWKNCASRPIDRG
jgi:hypothetical protein